MTVASSTNKNTYDGDGSTTVFPYTFRILDQSHIKVQVEDSVGVVTTKVITTDYTVSGAGASAGGNITFLTAPASTDNLFFTRNVPATQETDYVENDTFPAETHEAALDKVTMLYQQQLEVSDRNLVLPINTPTNISSTFPLPVASEYIRWNAAGTDLENAVLTSTGTIGLPVPVVSGGTGTTTGSIALSPGAVRTITVGNSTTGTGDRLDFSAGNALVGSTDKDGGYLHILAGDSTGTGSSRIQLQVAGGGSTGTTTKAVTTSVSHRFDGHHFYTNGGLIASFSQSSSSTASSFEMLPWGTSAGNTGEIRFKELAANGSGLVGFKAPDSITTDTVWTLPAADGTTGQVLTTNGSNILSFANADAALSTWEFIGSLTVTAGASSINFMGLTTAYSAYKIIINDYYNQVDLQSLDVRFFEAGVLQIATNYYNFGLREFVHDTTTTNIKTFTGNSQSFTSMASNLSSTSTERLNAEVTIYSPGNSLSSTYASFTTAFKDGAGWGVNGHGSLGQNFNGAIDGIRFYPGGGGNVANGQFYLYGIKNA